MVSKKETEPQSLVPNTEYKKTFFIFVLHTGFYYIFGLH